MSSASTTHPEEFFNDLSQPTGNGRPNSLLRGTGDMAGGVDGNEGDSIIQRPKKIACIICRKRKLKCDGSKPSCSTCTRLGHDCAYDPVRRKSGPKRGYVKALEERLKQVETMLKSQEPNATNPSQGTGNVSGESLRTVPAAEFNVPGPSIRADGERWRYESDSEPPLSGMGFVNTVDVGMGLEDFPSPWEMIGLGIEEPLPLQNAVDEFPPSQRPPVSLRYAIWTLAASVSEKYSDLKDHFYQRARKYLEIDSLKGFGESIISVSHAQAHILIASYEFKMMYLPRAWMSTGCAIRLCQILDKPGLETKQCLPPPRDWTEKEERRRTFWMAFCEDRYASIGTGWPMIIDENDIASDLPCSDEAFQMSRPETSQTLTEAMSPQGASKLSPFAGIVLMASLFGRNILHLHRSDADNRDNDLNGEFWKRHRSMDNILLNTSLCLPFHLRLPHGMANPNVVFLNMSIHASVICLHQAAILKAEKHGLPDSVVLGSKARAITSANEITSMMRTISHMDLSTMNPFLSFCLVVAARIFVQCLADTPKDTQLLDSLRFLLYAMNAFKKKSPLAESFLVQIDVDLEIRGMRHNKKFKDAPWNEDLMGSRDIVVRACPTPGGGNFPPGCNFMMRIPKDRGANTSPVENESQTNSQEGLRLPADAEQAGGGTTSSSGRTPLPHNFDIEKNNWRPSNENARARDLGRGVSIGQNRDPNSNPNSNGNASATAETMGTSMTPNTFSMPETQGRTYTMSGWRGPQPTTGTGLTPVGEGLFRHMMGLGPVGDLDSMDIWEGHS
ncbi:hypothetical protein SS1G_06754 [Sclerotinia sclerotiorum 1980 UF-70]|uniref:Zn(2)-C6 fungal-type domain-containing protein n=1 Tax=Sclerotinia sclerotiorum (strain ATCC 18683 / 1980 / Ss-1) TaxID=665079 RepID=A7EN55_SCLS1|nr:hypothetical protein SS1G_06754 [Sclerotinia sclerotiorum 1980 UF-70]EDO04271.1 hypothetical protein SS1G_06754 [Sclerotinia sclerotiorum 1980 UF-70]